MDGRGSPRPGLSQLLLARDDEGRAMTDDLAQRRADLYQDPAAFRPDRFAGQPPPAFGWFPFGGGIRRCLGASFATFEMRIVLPEVLRAVMLRPASPRPARIRREAVTFVPHDGARCVVTARIQPAA